MLLLPVTPENQNHVLNGIYKYLGNSDEKIREGFKSRLDYLENHFRNQNVVITGYSGGDQPMFDLCWYQKDDYDHPLTIGKKPNIIGGLVLHNDNTWGVHT